MSDEAKTIEAEAPDVIPAAPEAPAEDAPKTAKSQLEDAAKHSGWAPKDEWKGDPNDWIDAPAFILKAVGEVLPSMRQSLKDSKAEVSQLRKTLTEFGKHHAQTEQRAYERAARDIQARLDEAAAAGDVQGVRDATAELVDLNKEVQAKPTPQDDGQDAVEAFKEANPWFGVDEDMTDFAKGLRFPEDMPADKQMKAIEERVKKAFPHKFSRENPNRRSPAVAEGVTPPRPRGKTFADLPPDAKAMALQFERDIKGYSRETYAKDFFAS